ncbi:alcohol dehydrogenase [Fomes fomentarius]|nr:alcohol dehydrogenase [Fomes fomentarius]
MSANPNNNTPALQNAVRWYPPAYDIRLEAVPVPQIIDPDDAIVRVKLAGLCGSDLHIYRGHEDVDSHLTCGHEFIGEVIALGPSFSPDATGRPELYSTLRIGDKVVSPFTVSCGECHFCRIGFTCRCIHSCLFGIPTLPGGQAQYVRVPKAGGTLFSLSAHSSPSSTSSSAQTTRGDLSRISDSSLLLLADILPTGVFAVMQALQHPKISPILTGTPYPFGGFTPKGPIAQAQAPIALQERDRTFTVGVVGLGPVGVCATVSLLDILSGLSESHGLQYQVIAIDTLESRRKKMEAIYTAINAAGKGSGRFVVASIDQGKKLTAEWTDSVGCNAVLEVVGNNSALTLAYDLVQPFGIISSVGVHQEPPLPFSGRDVYNKNVSFDFGRCPVRAMFPLALEILLKRQDVFGGVGEEASLIDRIVGFDEAKQVYAEFDKGLCGKILFDPWRTELKSH